VTALFSIDINRY